MSRFLHYFLPILIFLISLTSLAPLPLFECLGTEYDKGYLPFQTYLPLEELSCFLVSVYAFFILWGGLVHH